MSADLTLAGVLTHGHGVEREFLCPVHGDSRPSASVNVLKGVWVCYTCGAKGNLDTVLGQLDHLELAEALLAEVHKMQRQEDRVIYTESWLNLFDAGPPHPYWLSRFGDHSIQHFRLGFDFERNAATYPMRDVSGRVLGVVRRPLEQEGGPKYLYPRGINVGDYLFNYSTDARKDVYLVEGAADAVALWEVGVEAFAIYGARLSDRQVNLIQRTEAKRVFCVFDLDEAGERAYELVAEKIKDREVHRIRWDRDWGKDIAEVDRYSRLLVIDAGLDQLGKSKEGLVGSPPCESSAKKLRVRVGRPPSASTSKPGHLRIVPPKT